ncbi:epoxyqueuosine reductase [Clostridium sp. 'White wine YQ']|uniref:epoxyqueuosine reductase n=1 Tax=Clostridium sp. 'White wine YQ' TaxID=3027474 RepID=UPI0023664226|nr:epoxyqueuosine reductase [Clostridium sp. 'White wine YQ']MDD7794430.1 epoxyqueuosine reductase [Clostridium sp. 'White wine YQ']
MLGELIAELKTLGASFIKFADISMLSHKENRGYSSAILIGIALSPRYIYRLSKENILDYSEFSEKEHRADNLADWTEEFIISKGYKAFSQSERNLLQHDLFKREIKTTPLPHKKAAVLAGVGFIGKNNLLVTKEYGSALCMCSVLIDVPLPIEKTEIIMPKCGECTICKDICPAKVIHGTTWEVGIDRDLIVDVYNCVTCLKCLSHCAWTQKYMLIKEKN